MFGNLFLPEGFEQGQSNWLHPDKVNTLTEQHDVAENLDGDKTATKKNKNIATSVSNNVISSLVGSTVRAISIYGRPR
jgi:hypothetical protein